MVKVLPPILNPFLYWLVAMIFETTKLSAAPNPASGPVSGWIQPIVMLPLLLLPLLALVVVLALEPLTPELHASSSPPPPTTAAPTPAMRSRPRLLKPSSRFVLPGSAVWSLMCNRSPLRSHRRRGIASEVWAKFT